MGANFSFKSPRRRKLWRLKYRHLGKEKLLAIGAYPALSLKQARAKRDEAKAILAAGGDPAVEKRRAAVAASIQAENTFAAVAEEFIAKREREELSAVTAAKAHWHLSLIAPDLGARPIADIQPFDLLAAVKKIEKDGRLETANRTLAFAGRVFRYAVTTARAERNIAADLQGALIAPKSRHYPAIVDPRGVGELLRAIDGFKGQPTTVLALRLLPHVFVRPGELRHAEWSEMDLDVADWRIPAKRMKMRKEHAVPLSRQAVAILKEARDVTGHAKLVFPGQRAPSRPISENTLNATLRRLGYGAGEMTSHGFRSTASTLLNESGKWNPDAIERALAHADADQVRAAYHRGAHWEERVRMAQWWSDYLDTLCTGPRSFRSSALSDFRCDPASGRSERQRRVVCGPSPRINGRR